MTQESTMSTSQIIWIVVIVVAALALIAVVVVSMRSKSRQDNKVRASHLRDQADTQAAGLPDAQAKAEQAEARAEQARLEAQRVEEQAADARLSVDRQQAAHEDQIRAADRLDPDVDHKSKDYSPQVVAPAGPSNVPADPAQADPATGRVTPPEPSTATNAPDTIFDRDDATHGSHESPDSPDGHESRDGRVDTAPRQELAGQDSVTLRDRLEGESTEDADAAEAGDVHGDQTGGSHRA